MPETTRLQALMAKHNLKSHDIAVLVQVNWATAKRWAKNPGPGYIPIPDDAWEALVKAIGEKQ